MKSLNWISHNLNETAKLGKTLAKFAKAGDIFCLSGNLGTGKTTLVKSIAVGLGIKSSSVQSPTFVLMSIHEGKLPIYHFDLYRLEDESAIKSVEYDEFFYGKGLAIVEWAERLKDLRPKECLNVLLEYKDKNPDERMIKLSAAGQRYEDLLDQLKNRL